MKHDFITFFKSAWSLTISQTVLGFVCLFFYFLQQCKSPYSLKKMQIYFGRVCTQAKSNKYMHG